MFGIFGKKFKRTAAAANVEIRKIENKDLMEAATGGMALICFADGTASAAEINKVENTKKGKTLPYFKYVFDKIDYGYDCKVKTQ